MNKISKEDLATIAAIIGAIASILGSLKALISVDPLFGWIALASVIAGLFWYLVQGQKSVGIISLLVVLALVSLGAAWWVGPVTLGIATYIDENRNGKCEAFEQKGPSGIEVQLLDSEGVVRVAYTDSEGVATFHGVPQGPYGIKVGPGSGGVASRVIKTASVAISPTPQPPTDTPTPEPTEEPTSELTEEPTPEPTEEPTSEPTEEPTPEPTEEPTSGPTEEPTPTATPMPDAVVIAPVNLRSGPGTIYDIIGTLRPNQVLTVTGRIADTTWLQVNTDQMQEGWVANLEALVKLNLSPEQIEQIPTVSPPSPPTPLSAAFTGKVCQIKSGWDENTIFLRQDEFNALGLPIGTKVTIVVRDTGRSVENKTLSLDSRLEICAVRLAKPIREALGVDADTAIEPERDRPDRQFDITPTSPPTNEEEITIQGRVCMIKAEQDSKTIFLRQAEFDAFGVPAGTTVSVIVPDTGKTVEKITLSLDSGIAICMVRIPKSYREALGVAGDTDLEPPENRPDRQISISLPQP